MASSGAGDDLNQIYYKCNFDYNKIKEVADKIEFKINEYLLTPEREE